MTNYHFTSAIPPSLVVHDKKAARKKLLEEVRVRRKENYKRFLQEQKGRLQAENDLI
jgi:hypothetical protein